MRYLARGVLTVAALTLGAQARAATVTFTLTSAPPPVSIAANVGPNSGTLAQDLTVTPFDVALGDLTSVTIEAIVAGHGSITAPPQPVPPGAPAPPPNSGVLSLIATSKLGGPLSLTLGSDTGNAFAVSNFYTASASYSFDTTTQLTASASLAAFLSSAPALVLTDSLAYGATYDWTNLSLSNLGFSSSFTTIVTYSYTPTAVQPPTGGVPEPAEWALMLLGLAAVGSSLRHRRTAAAL